MAYKKRNQTLYIVLGGILVSFAIALSWGLARLWGLQIVFAKGGFDQYGYNYTARLFNGTGSQWCQKKGLADDCLGIYSNDKLVMKWNAEWDRGNKENWLTPPYDAKLDNEWNGLGNTGGSGSVWHYKIKWVGPCGLDYTKLPDGGYCIWGQFETIMDQGKDPSVGPGHIWFAHAKPSGYGVH